MEVVCAVCGSDLTVVEEVYDTKNVLCPLMRVEVAPCCTCMSRAASEAKEGEKHE